MLKIKKALEILKYTIKEKIEQSVSKAEYPEFMRSLAQRLNISNSHLRKILNYGIEDRSEISASQLKIFSEALGCSMEDLFNEVEEQVVN